MVSKIFFSSNLVVLNALQDIFSPPHFSAVFFPQRRVTCLHIQNVLTFMRVSMGLTVNHQTVKKVTVNLQKGKILTVNRQLNQAKLAVKGLEYLLSRTIIASN